jgi:TolB-like protein/DNA-binding winged helix-turn-helix (wHTH) protein/Tfp pilus assembly protein PilF
MEGDFRVGDWLVHPDRDVIEFPEKSVQLEPKAMDLLVYLADHAGQVVSKERLIQAVWSDAFVTDEVLTNNIWKLRQAFGDDPKSPKFIETVPRKGYRLIAPVTPEEVEEEEVASSHLWTLAVGVMVLIAAGALAFTFDVGGVRTRLTGDLAPGEITSIAVLPLDNLMNDPEQDYFVEGMHEALIRELSKIGALRVIPRTSTMQFRDTDTPLPEIARQLGVDALVEGSVLRAEGRVRIAAQLMGVEPERLLWANDYDRQLDDILNLHSGVARRIAARVQIAITPEEEQRLSAENTVDPEAYEAYLKGSHHLSRRTNKDTEKALEYFKRATTLDPSYALAYVGTSDAYGVLAGYGMLPSESLENARTALGKAVEIDGNLAEARTSLAGEKLDSWDLVTAEKEFIQAIELNQNYATAHHWYSILLMVLGRYEEAIAEIELARELDPLSPMINSIVAAEYYWTREYEEALEEIQKALELDPYFSNSHGFLGDILLALGRHEEAVRALQKSYELDGGVPVEVGYTYALLGRTAEAREILDELMKRSMEQYVSPYAIALVHAGLGEKDQAFEWLERAFQEKSPQLRKFLYSPLWDPIRDDPRFEQLLRKLNLPEEAIQRHLAAAEGAP